MHHSCIFPASSATLTTLVSFLYPVIPFGSFFLSVPLFFFFLSLLFRLSPPGCLLAACGFPASSESLHRLLFQLHFFFLASSCSLPLTSLPSLVLHFDFFLFDIYLIPSCIFIASSTFFLLVQPLCICDTASQHARYSPVASHLHCYSPCSTSFGPIFTISLYNLLFSVIAISPGRL